MLIPWAASCNQDGPSLDLSFIDNSLDGRITFTRASTATYFDSAGVLQSAAINAARFDYDPSTLAARGLLIEEQRTNLWWHSGDIGQNGAGSGSQGWTVFGVATKGGKSTAVTMPDGSQNGQKVSFNSGSSSGVYQTFNGTPTNAASYTVSFWVATESGTSTARIGYFDGSTTTYGSDVVVTTTPTRITRTFTTTSANPASNVTLANGSGLNGGTVVAWGGQLELGAFATSYIPTVAAQVTRSADVATITGASFTGFFNQREGTFVVEALRAPALQTANYIDASDGASTAEEVEMLDFANTVVFRVRDGSADQFSQSVASGAVGALFKAALAYKANDFIGCLGGTLTAGDASGTVPTPTQLAIGRQGVGTRWCCSHIQRIRYYPQRLANSQLQALTA